VVPQYEELEGINVVRRMLGRTWIDPVRCERGLEALRGYRREYDERLKDGSRGRCIRGKATAQMRYAVLRPGLTTRH
jgi:hypothetical protein